MTYTVNPDTVLRASYGRYNEQPSAAYEQYNGLEQNLPDTLAQFYALGYTTPGHEVAPSVSYNSDLSIEHHFPGTDMSFKLSRFCAKRKSRSRTSTSTTRPDWSPDLTRAIKRRGVSSFNSTKATSAETVLPLSCRSHIHMRP